MQDSNITLSNHGWTPRATVRSVEAHSDAGGPWITFAIGFGSQSKLREANPARLIHYDLHVL